LAGFSDLARRHRALVFPPRVVAGKKGFAAPQLWFRRRPGAKRSCGFHHQNDQHQQTGAQRSSSNMPSVPACAAIPPGRPPGSIAGREVGAARAPDIFASLRAPGRGHRRRDC